MSALAARRYGVHESGYESVHESADDAEAIGPVPAHNGRRRPRRSRVVTLVGGPRLRDGEPVDTARVSPAPSPPATAGTGALAPQRVPAPRPPVAPVRVAPSTPATAARAPFAFGIVSLVVVGIVGLLVLNAKINENSFRLHDLRKQQASLDAQEQRLNEELVRLNAPGNLAAEARRLGLVPASTPAFIRLPDGRVLGVPKPAKAPAPDSLPTTSSPAPVSPTPQSTHSDRTGSPPGNGR